MSPHGYGLCWAGDIAVIEDGLARVCMRFQDARPLRLVEIGVDTGATARAMAAFVRARHDALEYHGIDPRTIPPPFPGAQMHHGDSAELYARIPAPVHFLLIDGCHCINHVMLDFLHYGALTVPGAVVVFHDTSARPNIDDYQGHGPRTHPDFGMAVRAGLAKLGVWPLRLPGWRALAEAPGAPNQNGMGVVALERTDAPGVPPGWT